jgi:peptidoglycan/xylan/chitin deacetylase (PgdA/CDA1 family)
MMKSLIAACWRLPGTNLLTSPSPVILLYHGIPKIRIDDTERNMDAEVFERHLRFIKKHFEFIAPDMVFDEQRTNYNNRILLTFDDGFMNNATVVAPLLKKYNIPAIFFVSTRHRTPGKYLWFNHLLLIEKKFPRPGFYFRGEFMDMDDRKRAGTIKRLGDYLLSLRPHPAAMYRVMEEELPQPEEFLTPQEIEDWCAGMTAEHLAELAAQPLFTVGVHTEDHPFLTLCHPEEQYKQLAKNKAFLARIGCREPETVSYPLGDYDAGILRMCRDLGFSTGYAVMPSERTDPALEIPRIGIPSPSLDILGFKIRWGNHLRKLRVKFG